MPVTIKAKHANIADTKEAKPKKNLKTINIEIASTTKIITFIDFDIIQTFSKCEKNYNTTDIKSQSIIFYSPKNRQGS
jgi:hypothetical protein